MAAASTYLAAWDRTGTRSCLRNSCFFFFSSAQKQGFDGGGFSLRRCGISTRALFKFIRFSEVTKGFVNSTKAALSKNRTILFQII